MTRVKPVNTDNMHRYVDNKYRKTKVIFSINRQTCPPDLSWSRLSNRQSPAGPNHTPAWVSIGDFINLNVYGARVNQKRAFESPQNNSIEGLPTWIVNKESCGKHASNSKHLNIKLFISKLSF